LFDPSSTVTPFTALDRNDNALVTVVIRIGTDYGDRLYPLLNGKMFSRSSQDQAFTRGAQSDLLMLSRMTRRFVAPHRHVRMIEIPE